MGVSVAMEIGKIIDSYKMVEEGEGVRGVMREEGEGVSLAVEMSNMGEVTPGDFSEAEVRRCHHYIHPHHHHHNHHHNHHHHHHHNHHHHHHNHV